MILQACTRFGAAIVAAVSLGATAQAATYSTQASYEAANTADFDVTFQGIAPVADYVLLPSPYAIGNVTLSSVAGAVADEDYHILNTPRAAYFVNYQGESLTIDFNAPVSAFGLSLAAGFDGGEITAQVFGAGGLIDTYNFIVADQHYFTGFTSFFGLDGVGGITSVVLTPDEFDFVLVDEIQSTVAGGVPEPATWALMIGGFGLAGATLRRRRLASPAC